MSAGSKSSIIAAARCDDRQYPRQHQHDAALPLPRLTHLTFPIVIHPFMLAAFPLRCPTRGR